MTLLIQANAAINNAREQINSRWTPRFHLAPPAGWMNDPNGLCWFDGYYHAFYQHHPYSPTWGPMHWGHARSRDMVTWEHLPVALAPEGPEDKDGCFSGSAVVAGDELALIYTGHKFHGEASEDNLYQVQCLATSRDGLHFARQGTVIDTPEGVHHFRDPKVWRENDRWYMVVGARVNDIGEVQLYESEDLRSWIYRHPLAQAGKKMGYMWECPDFFPLNDKHILMFSPQGIAAEGYQYRNLFQSGYMVGTWQDDATFRVEQPFCEMDHGHDFYAPQTFVTPDGRRIVIGWLAMWESPMPEKADGWAGMFSLPRELTLGEDGRVRMQPVKELEILRGECHACAVNPLSNDTVLLQANLQAAEIALELDVSRSTAEQFGLSLGKGARIYVDDQSRRLVVERDYPEHGLSGYRSVPLPAVDRLNLRIWLDSSSVEVFVNEGEFTLSSRIYPDADDRDLSLFSRHGTAVVPRVNIWSLNV